jgi:hypothetical protein
MGQRLGQVFYIHCVIPQCLKYGLLALIPNSDSHIRTQILQQLPQTFSNPPPADDQYRTPSNGAAQVGQRYVKGTFCGYVSIPTEINFVLQKIHCIISLQRRMAEVSAAYGHILRKLLQKCPYASALPENSVVPKAGHIQKNIPHVSSRRIRNRQTRSAKERSGIPACAGAAGQQNILFAHLHHPFMPDYAKVESVVLDFLETTCIIIDKR